MRIIIALLLTLTIGIPNAYSELETMDKPQVDQNNPEAPIESIPGVLVGAAAEESAREHARNKNWRRFGLITAGVLVATVAIVTVNQDRGRKVP